MWAPRFQPRARKGKTPLERSANADMKTQFNACQPNLELRELKYELKTTCRPSSALPTDLPMPLCTSGQLVLIRPLNTKLHPTNLIPRSMHPDTRLFSLTRFRCNPHTFPSLSHNCATPRNPQPKATRSPNPICPLETKTQRYPPSHHLQHGNPPQPTPKPTTSTPTHLPHPQKKKTPPIVSHGPPYQQLTPTITESGMV